MGGEAMTRALMMKMTARWVRKREGWKHFECILKVGPTRSLAVWL